MEEWQEQLNKHLAGAKNIAVMGIGNEMMGDDAAGALVARGLKKCKMQKAECRIEIFETSTTPENFNGAIRKLQPDLVVMVDAADMNQTPGTIAFLNTRQMHTMMHSTHTLPLSFLAGYLEQMGTAKVIALGIQAGHIRLDQPMTREVAESVKLIVKTFAGALCGRE
ncbi:MAG: hydrogenase 3 maturation endopeptidase HyCI [bacterium]|nr:hydrogenase 3 maturation endopeptidase HyCI [bacterium]